jgi:hypothetical protein
LQIELGVRPLQPPVIPTLGPSAARWKRTAWLLKDLASADRWSAAVAAALHWPSLAALYFNKQRCKICLPVKRLADFTDLGGGERLASFFFGRDLAEGIVLPAMEA